MDDKTVLCPECQNGVDLPEDARMGDVLECPFCGSELRITAFNSNGNAEVAVIEEEK